MLGIVLMNGLLFSCSNDENQELNLYQQDTEFYATGGEEDVTPPPPPETKP